MTSRAIMNLMRLTEMSSSARGEDAPATTGQTNGKLEMSDVTRILQAIEQGEPGAANELLPLVYEELRKLAAQRMAMENPGQTLQPTALVHEAWLRLVGNDNTRWEGRAHFFWRRGRGHAPHSH